MNIDHSEKDQEEEALSYLRAAPDAVVAVDSDGTITMANPRAEELFGYQAEALLGMNVDELVPDAARQNHKAHRTRYGASPAVRQMGDPGARLSAKHSSGQLVPVEIALSPLEVGEQRRVVAVIRDVSERLAFESEHETIRQSLDAVDDAVFMFSPETLEFSYVNSGALDQTGYSSAELTGGMTALDIKPEYDEATFRALLDPLLDHTRQASTFATMHRRRDGSEVPVEVSLSYPKTSHGLASPVVAIARDISERKEAEDRLRSSESAFRSAFDDAPVPMAIAEAVEGGSGDRKILQVNPSLSKLLGFSTDQLTGMTMDSLSAGDEPLLNQASVQGPAAEQTSAKARYKKADGSHIWVTVRESLLHTSDDSSRYLAHILDITRQVEAETERDRREDLLRALADIRQSAVDEAPRSEVLDLIMQSSVKLLSAESSHLAAPDVDRNLRYEASCVVASEGSLSTGVLPEDSASYSVMSRGVPHIGGQQLGFGSEVEAAEIGDTAGPIMYLPLVSSGRIEGVLIVARGLSAIPFAHQDLSIGMALANEAAVVLLLDQARQDRKQMVLTKDRERIARDLHDVVIQRIFATGMSLQASLATPEQLHDRIEASVTDLDETIAVIRKTIFELTQPKATIDGELERLVDRYRAGGRISVEFEAPDDLTTLPENVRRHLGPTISELLSNVERHANADLAHVRIVVRNGALLVTVVDDGNGMPVERANGFGLVNLANRAVSLGGNLSFGPGPDDRGTEVVWTVPLE